jgi:uncharacterized protein (TIGR02001 family)
MKMKAGWIGMVVTMTAVCGRVSAGEDSALGFEVTSDFNSKYVWRGQNLVDDWVWQPGISASYGGFTAGIWGNLDMTDENDESGEFTEYDFYGEYAFDLTDGIGLSFGYIHYKFPSGGNTQEVYTGISFATFLNPFVTVYYDFEDIDGTYVTAGIGHSIEKIADLTESIPVGLELALSVGWGDSNYNEGYWADSNGDALDDSGLNDLTLKIGFPMAIGSWTLTPSVNYVTLLDSDIREGLRSGDKDMFFTGVSLSTGF